MSVIVTLDGAMPMNGAGPSTQTHSRSQTERPKAILYDGKYHCLCVVVLFAERSVCFARVFAQIELARSIWVFARQDTTVLYCTSILITYPIVFGGSRPAQTLQAFFLQLGNFDGTCL